MYKISRYLESMRNFKNLSEDEMAKMIGVTVSRLRLIEKGHMPPPPETLILYANAVGLSVEALVVHFLNDYALEYCRRVRIGKKVTFTLQGDETCGEPPGLEAQLKFYQNQGRSLQLSEMRTTQDLEKR